MHKITLILIIAKCIFWNTNKTHFQKGATARHNTLKTHTRKKTILSYLSELFIYTNEHVYLF